MTRNHGWRFLSIGRHLERLSFVAATIASVADPSAFTEPALLAWLLDLSDSLITYRARHRHHPEWTAVVGLLLFDAQNPRAGVFQLSKLAKHVRQLPGAAADLGDLVDARRSRAWRDARIATSRRASSSSRRSRSRNCSATARSCRWRLSTR